jgi:hypothetical protein
LTPANILLLLVKALLFLSSNDYFNQPGPIRI